MRKKLLWILLLVPAFTSVLAQPLPQDTVVRKGTLPNGLTYYIGHNAKAPHIADFYIAQRVGSILEEPRQRGLAHFLEHMAFNGTEHFPGNANGLGIIPWCESIGIKFGANLNAYTSIDETVYNISSAPVERESVLDSCLLILHDWSHSLLLSDTEIDKERGVVHEEWRTRRAGMATQRLMEEVMPTMYKGTKYADCMPIGDMNIVDHFPYKDLRDYYKKWYRPDLQAIIVVGDIDVDKVEAKIRALFSKIPIPKDPAPRTYYPVNDNDSIIVAEAKDKEQPTVNVALYMKRDATPDAEKNSVNYLLDNYKGSLVTIMINERLQELAQQADPPFISASVRDGLFFISKTKDAFSGNVMCKQDRISGGVAAFAGIIERTRRYGFTESELTRAKANYFKRIQKAYDDRSKRENSSFIRFCLQNFLNGEPMLTPGFQYTTYSKFTQEVTLSQVNDVARELITDKNQVVTLYAPDKPEVKMPSEEELTSVVRRAQRVDYTAYVDKAVSAKLIPHLPTPGKIVSRKLFKHGITEIVLSNGVKVYIKPTTFSGNLVNVNMFDLGGTSFFSDADIPNLALLNSAISVSGVGQFSASDLKKILAGKLVKVDPFVGETTQGIKGACSGKDLKTMFELSYLYFNSPHRDTVAFAGLMNRMRSFLTNRDANPKVTYTDSIASILYGNNPRVMPVKLETLDHVNYDRIMEIYKKCFSNVSGLSVILVGNVNIDSIRPLLCQYLATLPVKGEKMMFKDTHSDIRAVDETHMFACKQQTPSTLVSIYNTGKVDYNAQNDLTLDVLAQALRIVYTEKVREDKGGTYGVSVNGQLDKYPNPGALLTISFRTDPAKYADLISIIYRELDVIAKQGPSLETLSKIKKYLIKTYLQNLLTNEYWDYVIYNQLYRDIDFYVGYDSMVNKLTVNDVKEFAQKLLMQKHRIELTMTSDPSTIPNQK